MKKELLIYLVNQIANARGQLGNKHSLGTVIRTHNCLRAFEDELPDWIDMEDKTTRRNILRLPNFGKKTLEFLIDIVKDVNSSDFTDRIDFELKLNFKKIKKLTDDIKEITDDIEELTKLREAA